MTLLFLIIIFLFKKKYLFIFKLLYLLSYILQYSGINYIFFVKNFSTHSRSTFGRFFEAIPFAITGIFLASHNILEINKKNKKKLFFHSLIILILITKYQIDKMEDLYVKRKLIPTNKFYHDISINQL